jgi:hypothetical protein
MVVKHTVAFAAQSEKVNDPHHQPSDEKGERDPQRRSSQEGVQGIHKVLAPVDVFKDSQANLTYDFKPYSFQNQKATMD